MNRERYWYDDHESSQPISQRPSPGFPHPERFINSHDGEEEKVEVPDPLSVTSFDRPSGLEVCLLERKNKKLAHSTAPKKSGAFYDDSYDDLLEQKRAAYASPSQYDDYDRDYQRPAPLPRFQETMIELGPGVFARLRGANETWACIERDFHMPVLCLDCSLELCCIQDADFVLCPRCKVVSPLEGRSLHNDGGVGLGFTFDDLFKWQAEIIRQRTREARARASRQHNYFSY